MYYTIFTWLYLCIRLWYKKLYVGRTTSQIDKPTLNWRIAYKTKFSSKLQVFCLPISHSVNGQIPLLPLWWLVDWLTHLGEVSANDVTMRENKLTWRNDRFYCEFLVSRPGFLCEDFLGLSTLVNTSNLQIFLGLQGNVILYNVRNWLHLSIMCARYVL